jgi:hypothetical protein
VHRNYLPQREPLIYLNYLSDQKYQLFREARNSTNLHIKTVTVSDISALEGAWDHSLPLPTDSLKEPAFPEVLGTTNITNSHNGQLSPSHRPVTLPGPGPMPLTNHVLQTHPAHISSP